MFFVEVKNTEKMGRGVFAAKDFSPGEIIEICPAIPLTPEEIEDIRETRLENWFFEWHDYDGTALVLGNGMIYNHSPHPNAGYEFDYVSENIIFRCLKPIKNGDQIFYNYNQYRDSDEPIEMFDPQTKNCVIFSAGKLIHR